MGTTSLPPGFRFHPTDVELVKYYLKRKVMGRKHLVDCIAEVNIYKYAPWDLPGKSSLKSGDLKWYFFCPREKKFGIGSKVNRANEFGYWKTSGRDRQVLHKNEIVGFIKTLVFHRGRAPNGERTDWIMHEYRLQDKDLEDRGISQDCYVLCIIFHKEGPGPKNGAQYGAPFNEEEWSDGEEVNNGELIPSSIVASMLPYNQIQTSGDMSSRGLCESGPSTSALIAVEMHMTVPDDNPVPTSDVYQIPKYNDDVLEIAELNGDTFEMLTTFKEEDALIAHENDKIENLGNLNKGYVEGVNSSQQEDIYNNLVDLSLPQSSFANDYDFNLDQCGPFLELDDFNISI